MANSGDGVARRQSTIHSTTPAWLVAVIIVFALVMAAFALGVLDAGLVRRAVPPHEKAGGSSDQTSPFDVDRGVLANASRN